MQAWMAYATPGDPHKTMSTLVGTWDIAMTNYMDPSGKPTEQKATATFKSLMDGRYIVEEIDGNIMGQPFHGMGTYGYDNGMKKYVSTWIDNMGTGIMTGTGTSSDGGKTITWLSRGYDAMSGKEADYRSTVKIVSDDQLHFEMYGPGPDGKEAKIMESTYTRKK